MMATETIAHEERNVTATANPFRWYELVTTDHDAAMAFYGKVAGWTITDSGITDRRYSILSAGPNPLGGIMGMEVPRPFWLGYVAVDDVDAYVGKVTAAGGAVHHEAEDIPGVGRFAVVADPQGAAFALWKDLSGVKAPELPPMAVGHVGWHELYTGDVEKALGFYAEKFGWLQGEALDMGPTGFYQLFSTGGHPVGGILRRPPNIPQSFWNFYFTVPALDATLAKVEKAGGKIANGPMEVRGGAWIAQCFDPQGAFFSLFAATR